MYASSSSSRQLGRPNNQAENPAVTQRGLKSLYNDENNRTAKRTGSNGQPSMERRVYPPADLSSLSPTTHEETLLRLNVGGSSFSLRSATIRNRADGFLCWFSSIDHQCRLQQSDGYLKATEEYFFERSPHLFTPIYQFYTTGVIHRSAGTCAEELIAELNYWNIPQSAIAECCADSYGDSSDDVKDFCELNEKEDDFHGLKFAKQRKVIWNMIENPNTSKCAQIYAAFSISFVLLSITGLVLGSIPELQVPVAHPGPKSDRNGTRPLEREPHPLLGQLEFVCIVWFTTEYLTKMLVAANRWKTFTSALNVVDLMAIVPFYIELSLGIVGFDTERLRDLKGALLVIRILRVLRVVRIFKLGRYSSGLQTFAKTLSASMKQLGMMAMVMMTGVIFFSTLVYFLEKDEPDSVFYSIPAAFWWCMVTMTTVGYGDVVPVTIAGKLVASGAIACGVLVLALPITIIVDNFIKVSDHGGQPFSRRSSNAPHPYMMKSARSSLMRNSLIHDSATSQLTLSRSTTRKSVQIEDQLKI
uniref:BTB domain-containing protein n=1 Tax=Plectus sambesii TaxID=2011161 RepID=A0A914W3Y6_9BILA